MRHIPVLMMFLLLAACGTHSPGGNAGLAGNGDIPGDLPMQSSDCAVPLAADDPALETDPCVLAAPLKCTSFDNPDKEPVLLIHGTFTNGPEQYLGTYVPFLREQGFDVCYTTYPDRGFGDQQLSAEYVVYAVLAIAQQTGQLVDMVGHSQGASMPRWAIRWWPSVQRNLDDFVLHAGPVRGTTVSDPPALQRPPGFWQFQPGSDFVAAVNSVDETPGDVDYTSIYTSTDELVQPQPLPLLGGPSASDLEPGADNPRRINIWLQDICPTAAVTHVSIGTVDGTTAQLTVDAFLNDGPADVARAGGAALCAATPIGDPGGLPDSLQGSINNPPPDAPFTAEEPPLRPYAQP